MLQPTEITNYQASELLLEGFFSGSHLDSVWLNTQKLTRDLLHGFGNIVRIDGSPYVWHLIRTYDNCSTFWHSNNWENYYDTETWEWALLHDSIEDVPDHHFEYISDEYSHRTALLVQSVTKPSFEEFWKIYHKNPQIHDSWESFKRLHWHSDSPFKLVKKPLKETPTGISKKSKNIWNRFQHDCNQEYQRLTYQKFQSMKDLREWFSQASQLVNHADTLTLAKKSILIKWSDRNDNLGTLPPWEESSILKINNTQWWYGIVSENFPDLWKNTEWKIRTYLRENSNNHK